MADNFNVPENQLNRSAANSQMPKRSSVFSTLSNRAFRPGSSASGGSQPPNKKRMLPAFWYRWSRRTRLLASLAVILILALSASAVYVNYIGKVKGEGAAKSKQAAPTVAPSPLTGVKVPIALTKRPVTAIMIENSPDARPQSGLQDAGVVYEAIAEGGITRFVALFQESRPQYVGPVRSLRPYYIDFFTPFDASIAHVGGSPDALSQIRSGGKDLDQFFNADSYWRVGSRAAPHNVYTSFDRMDALNNSKGYTASKVQSWPRKTGKAAAQPTVTKIDLAISGPLYSVHYDFDAASNSYLRSEGGAPHMNTASEADSAGVRLAPKVVVALVMNYNIAADGEHSEYGDTGGGEAAIFQGGQVIKGTWTKADRNSQFVFKDANGAVVQLAAGQTWVTLVQPGGISYQ